MSGKRSGWFGESHRHSLAQKRVSTSVKRVVPHKLKVNFKRGTMKASGRVDNKLYNIGFYHNGGWHWGRGMKLPDGNWVVAHDGQDYGIVLKPRSIKIYGVTRESYPLEDFVEASLDKIYYNGFGGEYEVDKSMILKADGRWKGGSEVQSVVFSKDKWSRVGAERWLREHGFDVKKVDDTGSELRFRQESPKKYEDFRSIPFGEEEGIRAIVAGK